MLFDVPLAEGRLIRRYKRFLADIEPTAGGRLTVHCPNTGAMTGCAEPGWPVWYSTSDNPKRKYPHTLEAVHTDLGLVGVNTGRANGLVGEALRAGRLPELAGFPQVRSEVPIPGGGGRFDFLLEGEQGCCYVEVKSLTLCAADGTGRFPDAVSERARKHVESLIAVRAGGHGAALVFCVQHEGVRRATTADDIDPLYGEAVRRARRAGVQVLAYGVRLSRREFVLAGPLPLVLD